MDEKIQAVSKFLSYVLRHRPDSIGLTLDSQGWADIDSLIERAQQHGNLLSRALIEQAVSTNDKQRFAMSPDGVYIRARQGHSVSAELALEPSKPPDMLYHGTASRNVDSILREGLKKGERHHVHLSTIREVAINVGSRYGKPVVLQVQALKMVEAGFCFYVTDNQVWLTDHVPVSFLVFPY